MRSSSGPTSAGAGTDAGAVVLALDVGGTKLAAGLVEPSTGRVLAEARRPTPADHGADAVLHALLQVAGQAARAGGLDLADVGGPGVGVGCGGPMRWPEGVVSPLNLPVWRDFPLRARLADALGRDDVVVHNDVVAFALAEAVHGAGTDATSLLGVAVSTGVGGGMVVDGRPVPGPRGQAGHVGHVVVEPDGPRCGCGGRGCLEAVARGPALAPRAGYADGHALVRAARDGEDAALQALARAGRGLGRALAGAAALLDLDVVVVGGGLGRAAFDLLEPAVHRGLGEVGLPWVRELQVRPAGLEHPHLVGAALLPTRGAVPRADREHA